MEVKQGSSEIVWHIVLILPSNSVCLNFLEDIYIILNTKGVTNKNHTCISRALGVMTLTKKRNSLKRPFSKHAAVKSN